LSSSRNHLSTEDLLALSPELLIISDLEEFLSG
jgi:hypothetical protein